MRCYCCLFFPFHSLNIRENIFRIQRYNYRQIECKIFLEVNNAKFWRWMCSISTKNVFIIVNRILFDLYASDNELWIIIPSMCKLMLDYRSLKQIVKIQVRLHRSRCRNGGAYNCQEIERQSMVESSVDWGRTGRAVNDVYSRTRVSRGQLELGLEFQNWAHGTSSNCVFR